MKITKYPTWLAVAQTLDQLTDQLIEFHEHVPRGISPRKFRSELKRAQRALSRAAGIASDRADEDTLHERQAALSKQRAEGIPELPHRMPVRLRQC